MKVFTKPSAWRDFRSAEELAPLGFVPTMGALHAGHSSLVARSQAENQHTLVSLFVNPTQFDQAGDLEAYPVQQQSDLDLLESLGVDFVLIPDYKGLYPDDYRYRVAETSLSKEFCGAHRPGHFDGMLSVVMRLFNIVQPQQAYFGEKDYQQLELVKGMVEAFFMEVKIVACPTVREADGLAMSSRNQRLSEDQRSRAAQFYEVLESATSADSANFQLLDRGFKVEYVGDHKNRRLAAVRLGEVRLIDNVPIGPTADL